MHKKELETYINTLKKELIIHKHKNYNRPYQFLASRLGTFDTFFFTCTTLTHEILFLCGQSMLNVCKKYIEYLINKKFVIFLDYGKILF